MEKSSSSTLSDSSSLVYFLSFHLVNVILICVAVFKKFYSSSRCLFGFKFQMSHRPFQVLVRIGPGEAYLPHHFSSQMGPARMDNQIDRKKNRKLKEVQEHVEPKGEIVKEEIMDMNFVGGSGGKKRKMVMLGWNEENNINMPYHPEPPTPINTTPLNLDQITALMLSSEFAPILVSQGLLNPAVLGFFDNTGMNIEGILDIGMVIGNENMDRMGEQYITPQIHNSDLGDEPVENHPTLNIQPTEEGIETTVTITEEIIITVDRFGGLEGRTDENFAQVANNLMPISPYELQNNQVTSDVLYASERYAE